MGNIHVLATDKPSRLLQSLKVIELLDKEWLSPIGNVNRNICITSDEEIKEGWVLVNGFILRKVDYIDGYMVIDTTGGKHHNSVCEKIILTTDQDLIKDGVQAIDDIFLEWFVKNPTCEIVEIKPKLSYIDGKYIDSLKIIIPQEEPNYNGKDEILWISNNLQCKQVESCYNSLSKKCICSKEPKQETLEEVSPMNDLLKDLRETKISVKESIDTIEDEFMRTQINIFVQKTLDSVIYRIENELLEIESKWQQEQDKNKSSEGVICKHCNKIISVEHINNHLFMVVKSGGLIHWSCKL
jgi:hypothetical protein